MKKETLENRISKALQIEPSKDEKKLNIYKYFESQVEAKAWLKEYNRLLSTQKPNTIRFQNG